MGAVTHQGRRAWALARRQHGAIAWRQLRRLGFSERAIAHRVAVGRLHRTEFRGVYSVGRPDLSELGRLMAAVLGAGEGAVLSGSGAAFLWKVRSRRFPKDLEVTVPGEGRSRDGLRIRRRRLRDHEVTIEQGIPVTTPLATLIDLATVVTDKQLEAAINEADKLDLVPAHEIPALVDAVPRRPGKRRLAELITKHVPKRTDTGLERALLKIIREAKLPLPETQYVLDGDRVDFYWPDIGLVVETDGGRYHRTPLQRAADTRRDQKHFRAGRTPLRFSDDDVDHPAYVERVLADVIARLCD